MTLSLAAHAPPLRQDRGALRVGRSNVTLEAVLWAFKQGATPEQIIDQSPTITLADAYVVGAATTCETARRSTSTSRDSRVPVPPLSWRGADRGPGSVCRGVIRR